jgi:hypothetical protein
VQGCGIACEKNKIKRGEMKLKYKGYTIHISYRAFIETKDGKVLVNDTCELIESEENSSY